MRWASLAHPKASLQLAYCLNAWPAHDARAALDGLRALALPLRRALAPGARFGLGLHLSARAAHELEHDAALFGELVDLLGEEQLYPFTWNAFPFGDFHAAGQKAGVFQPGWADTRRLEHTLRIARLAARLAGNASGPISISTHCGRHGAWRRGGAPEAEQLAAEANLARCAFGLARLAEQQGVQCLLALEPEPRSSCNDTAELGEFLGHVRERGAEVLGREADLAPARAAEVLVRHLGACLDACHGAVEFEQPSESLAQLERRGIALGKLQFSSALALREPARHALARARLLALDEPVYLHQVTARTHAGLVRVGDLNELARALEHADSPWLQADEWRCHFHVPVDLEAEQGLDTTRAHADELLRLALARADQRGGELHLEIETYTWSVLPGAPRASASESAALVERIAREYAHVARVLEAAGWARAAG